MWGLRRQVSLLLDHGHHQARHYPIGMVWEEVQIVVERTNHRDVSSTTLFHAAGAALLSKKGHAGLKKLLKELSNG